jgi:hypothetical protein
MTHTEYIQELTTLQDSEGKRLSAALLGGISKLLRASNGNPNRFKQILKVMRERLIQEALVEVRRGQIKAKQLGRSFLESK